MTVLERVRLDENRAKPLTAGELVRSAHLQRWEQVRPAPGRCRVTAGRDQRLAVGVPMLLTALFVQTWFRPGRFLASGDRGPFVVGLDGITRIWGYGLTGTGSTAPESPLLLDRLVHDLVLGIGGSSTLAERIVTTLVVAAAAGATAWLACTVVRRWQAAAAAGLVAVLNPFHIFTLPNLLPMVAIAACATAAGTGVRAWQRRPVHPAAAALLAVAAAPLARNPPLLVLFAAVVGVSLLAAQRSGFRHVLRTMCWFGAGSLSWLVPVALHYLSGTPGLAVTATTDVGDWAWTHRNSQFPNVVSLVAAWAWGDPDTNPASATLSGAGWWPLRFALPTLALAAVLVSTRRRLAATLVAFTAVLLVFSVGFVAPFESLNRFLTDVIPGWWLFREPMTKFGVLIVPAYAVLVALTVDGLARWRTWRLGGARAATYGATLLGLAAVAFAHPLWLGTVVPGERAYLPPGRSAIPAEWYRIADWLDRAPGTGSVLVLPLSEYYQRGTEWGYYGVDDLVDRLVDRPALFQLPGGYYAAAGAVPGLLQATEDAVLSGNGPAADRLLDALGVRYVLVRTDLELGWGTNRTFADGHALAAAARGLGPLEEVAAFDHAAVFVHDGGARITAATEWVDAVAAPVPRPGEPAGRADLAAGVGTAPAGLSLVDDDGSNATAVAATVGGARPSTFVDADRFAAADDPVVTVTTRRNPLWEVARRADGTIDVTLVSGVAVDGQELVERTGGAVDPVAPALAVEAGGSVLLLGDEPLVVQAGDGGRIRVLGGEPLDVRSTDGELGNCDNAAGETLRQAGIEITGSASDIRLQARRGSACLFVPVPVGDNVVGDALWRVEAEWVVRDGSARLCLWLPDGERCAEGGELRPDATTGAVDLLVSAPATEAGDEAVLVLYADRGVAERADVTWRRVRVTPFEQVGSRLLTLDAVRTTPVPVAGEGILIEAEPADTTDFAGTVDRGVGDCNRWSDASPEEAGLAAEPLPGEPGPAVELRARLHAACVTLPVTVPAGVRLVEVAFEHRTLSGRGGRWALVDDEGDVVAGGLLTADGTWQERRLEVPLGRSSRPGTLERTYDLYLYADGDGTPDAPSATTVVQYRAVSLRPAPAFTITVFPEDGTEPPSARLTELDERTASLTADGPTLVVLRESFAAGWRMDGLPTGATARHVTAEGWANGWIVDGLDGRTARLSFRYAPDRLTVLAVWSAAAVIPFALLVLVRPALRRRIDERRTVRAHFAPGALR